MVASILLGEYSAFGRYGDSDIGYGTHTLRTDESGDSAGDAPLTVDMYQIRHRHNRKRYTSQVV